MIWRRFPRLAPMRVTVGRSRWYLCTSPMCCSCSTGIVSPSPSMASLISSVLHGYHVLNEKWSDPRTKDMFLMSSPFPGLLVLALYLRFVNVWGPRFMQNRPAYNLERVIIAYNTLNVIVSAWLFREAYVSAWGNGYSLKCQPVDFSDDPNALRIMRSCYVYFILKIVELLDTVFFILRKKFNQASFLHVYHHTGMVMLAWGGVKYLPGGHGTFLGFINTFVHIVMYAYYLITALYPQYKKNIWWKKHITQMQIIQFAMIIVHSLQLLFRDCDYPSWTVGVVVPQNLFMMLLFSDFYRKAYLTPARKQEERKEINGGPKQS